MPQNKVCLSFGRHGRYGHDTAIDRGSMLEAFLSGRKLKTELPSCSVVYHSPVARAALTAEFRAKGLNCSHFLAVEQLTEDAPASTVHRFVNLLLADAPQTERHYHFVTHLPVIEKLGLPDLGVGEICVCEADDWNEMLAENFSIRLFPNVTAEELKDFAAGLNMSPDKFDRLSAEEILALL